MIYQYFFVIYFQVLSGTDPVNIRAKLKNALPRSPEKQLVRIKPVLFIWLIKTQFLFILFGTCLLNGLSLDISMILRLVC